MALIECPECKKMISDKATNCIHCGAPLFNKAVKSIAVVKVGNLNYTYPFLVQPFDIVGIFDENNRKLVSLKQGETKEFEVNRDMTVKAMFLQKNGNPVTLLGYDKDKCSKPVQIYTGTTNKLMVSGTRTFGFIYLSLSKVDIIDSD